MMRIDPPPSPPLNKVPEFSLNHPDTDVAQMTPPDTLHGILQVALEDLKVYDAQPRNITASGVYGLLASRASGGCVAGLAGVVMWRGRFDHMRVHEARAATIAASSYIDEANKMMNALAFIQTGYLLDAFSALHDIPVIDLYAVQLSKIEECSDVHFGVESQVSELTQVCEMLRAHSL